MLYCVMAKTTERITFKLLQAPCCGILLCWVNPRLPNYCPECGTHIFPAIRSCVLSSDDTAFLKVEEQSYVKVQDEARIQASGDGKQAQAESASYESS